MKELEQFLENELNGLALKKSDWVDLTIEDDSRERTLLEVQEVVKKLTIPVVVSMYCDCDKYHSRYEESNNNCASCDKPID
jgi:hypothetical protein